LGEPEGIRTLESPKHRWENNIKMNLKGNRNWRILTNKEIYAIFF
jgi:hypothetical protein